MNATAIFYPCFALAALTFFVWLVMLIRRAQDLNQQKIHPQQVATRAQANEKFVVSKNPNDNLMNLFELPVLFYLVAIMIERFSVTSTSYLVLAWGYVALRIVHSLIHITYNRVLHRGLVYLTSCVVLWVIWVKLAISIL